VRTGLSPAQAKPSARTLSQALVLAAQQGQTGKVRALLARGADANGSNELGHTPLLAAALHGHLDTSQVLIDAGADVNARLHGNLTALMLAARQGDIRVVDHLLSNNADVNARDKLGDSVLVYAMDAADSAVRLPLVQRLLAAGADINARRPEGDSVLHALVQKRVDNNGMRVLRLLLDRKANVNVRGYLGYTPLMRAAYWSRNPEAAAALVAHGAQVEATNEPGETALMLAAQVDETVIIGVLVRGGADVNRRDRAKKTALIHAAQCLIQAPVGADTIKALLAAGARVDLKDNSGKTAADYARARQRGDIVRLLTRNRQVR
jgi:ankyrin repeat protein